MIVPMVWISWKNNHFKHVHGLTPDNLIKNFKVIKKCRGKLECSIYEMLWIKNKRLKLIMNRQADSIHAKLFTWVNAFMLIYFLTFDIYKYAFSLFLIYSFDNDVMNSSKRHAALVSLIFLLNNQQQEKMPAVNFGKEH